MTKKQVKEFLWWVLGVILAIVLLFLTAAMSAAQAAQPGKTESGLVDYVGRSLNKTIVIKSHGQTEIRPSFPGAGIRQINRADPPKKTWSNGKRYDDRRTWKRQ